MISIIIPVYNERNYLFACVNSVLSQTYRDFELILVDDGSTNGAGNDCDELANSDNRIKVIHKKNEGLSAARMTGYMASQGDWIMFVDHDDMVSPYILERLNDNINDEIDIVSGARLDMNNPESYSWTNDRKGTIIKKGLEIVEMIPSDREQKLISTPLWGKIYRRTFLDGINLEQLKDVCPTIFFEDVLMTPILFYQATKICIIPEVLYIHREVASSVSRRGGLSEYYFEQIYSGDYLLCFSKENKLSKFYSYQLGIYIISILRIYCLMDSYKHGEELNRYRKLIKEKERKYRADFYLKGNASFTNKALCLIYDISPYVLKKISKFYYRK